MEVLFTHRNDVLRYDERARAREKEAEKKRLKIILMKYCLLIFLSTV